MQQLDIIDLGNVAKIVGSIDAVNPQDLVNLRTAQGLIQNIGSKNEVAYATTVPLPANVYNNGAAGVGATLTAVANGALAVDGQAPAVGMRILVKNEANAVNNGIYVVTATGDATHLYILTRALDADANNELGPGVLVPVESPAGTPAGAANNGSIWIGLAPSPFTTGTSTINFGQFGSAYTAGTGLTLAGTQFSLTTPVAVANGGTGSTTAAGALVNLGATRKATFTIGDGAATNFVLAHNLNTQLIGAFVLPHGGGTVVGVDWNPNDANHITVTFTTAPAVNAYDVVVLG